MDQQAWRAEAAACLADVLRSVLRTDGVRLVAVDSTDGGALVTFHAGGDPRLLGRTMAWVETDGMTPGDWAGSVWMHELPWTTYGTRRVDRGACIEVTDEDVPHDHRFFTSVPNRSYDGGVLRAHGFDTSVPLAARGRGDLIAWLMAYVNNKHAEPVVAQAAVVRVDDATARIEAFDVHPLAPVTLTLDLAFSAAVQAASAGCDRLLTSHGEPRLTALGLDDAESERVLDLSLLAVDVDAWSGLVQEATAAPLPTELVRPLGSSVRRGPGRVTTRTSIPPG